MHIWALQIWTSGVSLKRYCKMKFRRVVLRSIGPSSQNLWPNPIFGWFPHCNYIVKLHMRGNRSFMGLKIWQKNHVLVACMVEIKKKMVQPNWEVPKFWKTSFSAIASPDIFSKFCHLRRWISAIFDIMISPDHVFY